MLHATVCLLRLFKVVILAKGIKRAYKLVSLSLMILAKIQDGLPNKLHLLNKSYS